MTDSLRNDQRILRTFILYEALERNPVFDAYKHFCKVMGEDVMEYREFEYWFYRFYHGNYDLDCDKVLNRESRHFIDLPVDVIGKVVEKLELTDQLILRKVSHSLRTIVDNHKPAYKRLHVNCDSALGFLIEFNNTKIAYLRDDVGYVMRLFCDKSVKEIKCESLVKTAFGDLAIALKNSKLRLEDLNLVFKQRTYMDDNVKQAFKLMKGLLNSLNHKINVKSFSIKGTKEEVLEIVLHLEPGYLEAMQFTLITENGRFPDIAKIDEIITLDQWKQAKHVTINVPVSVPIEAFSHFKTFDIHIGSNVMETLIHLRDALVKSAKFENCTLRFEDYLDLRAHEKQLELQYDSHDIDPNFAPYHFGYYPILDSNEFLEFKLYVYSPIGITRKSRT